VLAKRPFLKLQATKGYAKVQNLPYALFSEDNMCPLMGENGTMNCFLVKT
jgi:hypothetical protein